MKERLRKLWPIFSLGAACVIVLTAGLLFVLQTSWFKNKVRERVVEIAERATGGKVEIGSFDYDWRTLNVRFCAFTVHGTEGSGAAPLFRADSVKIGLKIVSILKRDVDIASLELQHPVIHLVVAPDGVSNVPNRASVNPAERLEALFKLRVKRVRVANGWIETDVRRIAVDAHGEGVDLTLRYEAKARHYDAAVFLHKLHFDSGPLAPFPASVEAQAELGRDRLRVKKATFYFENSSVEGNGMLEHFARPLANFALSTRVATDDVTRAEGAAADLRGGAWKMEGTGRYEAGEPFAFRGRIAAKDVNFRIGAGFRHLDLQSDISARPGLTEFARVSIESALGRFEGKATLEQYRRFTAEGAIAGASVHEALTLFAKQSAPWSGTAAGPILFNAEFGPGVRIVEAKSKLDIKPGAAGTPISGELEMNYRAAGSQIAFGESHLRFGSTELEFSGGLGTNLRVNLDSQNFDDLRPVLNFASVRENALDQIKLAGNGSVHFNGSLRGDLKQAQIAGQFAAVHFRAKGQEFDRLEADIIANSQGVNARSFLIKQAALEASGSGRVGLQRWEFEASAPMALHARFKGADLARLSRAFPGCPLQRSGVASGTVMLDGLLSAPHGAAQLALVDADVCGEHLQQLQASFELQGNEIEINRGHLREGSAQAAFTGAYRRAGESWRTGDLSLKVDSNQFPASDVSAFKEREPALEATVEIHGSANAHVVADRIELSNANGKVTFARMMLDGAQFGSVTLDATTQGRTLESRFEGNLREAHVGGKAETQLVKGLPTRGELQLGKTRLATLHAILDPRGAELTVGGFLRGAVQFEGPLEHLEQVRGTVNLPEVQLNSASQAAKVSGFVLRNLGPVEVEFADGAAKLSHIRMAALGSTLTVSGSVPYIGRQSMDVTIDGAADLSLLKGFNSNLQASGGAQAAVSVKGTWTNPVLSGSLAVRNGTVLYAGLPNGLTDVNGSVRFDQNRATVQRLTAKSGGGDISLGGFVSFGRGEPVVYRLEAMAENVRVRYAGSVSITANSRLRLTGTSESSILSGAATVSRAVFNPNTDIGNLLAFAATSNPVAGNEKDFLTGLQFDVHVESAPNLLLNTELGRDIETEVDLRVRGTPGHPVVIGSIAANQGDIKVFGTKYGINRGEVRFTNPVKVEPVLDLDLQTQARGITVDITISGTPGKLNINYRSDPPLQPRDIIALLTVGRTPDVALNVPNAQVTNDVSALQSGANTVLGQAISPVSNRLSKLFGITNIKIDPLVQGITNTPQARLTLEQQISRQITVTYVTNLSQTSEQIFRLEWAFSPQYSLVALRDDNGEFGIDIQYKKRFK